jgi:hypothetical protein
MYFWHSKPLRYGSTLLSVGTRLACDWNDKKGSGERAMPHFGQELELSDAQHADLLALRIGPGAV